MCIAAFLWSPDTNEPLLLAANRDEFYERPTERAHWWPGDEVLAGRDLRSGGAWLGISRHGRFAMITNIRNPALRRESAPSRGELVRRFVEGTDSAQEFITSAASDSDRYEGFNLLCGELAGAAPALWFVNSQARIAQAIEPGIHGFSNASLDTPWPKLLRLKSGFRHALAERDPGKRGDRLQRLLHNTTPTPDAQLPNTGVPFDVERMLGSIFIRSGHYGTRASTLLSVRADHVTMSEAGFGVNGEPQARVAFTFGLQHS
ncbi:MAG: NRDE family protein [Burkholderiales bacterium]|nr:NRDE family protein [Burkholderiales bacterium]